MGAAIIKWFVGGGWIYIAIAVFASLVIYKSYSFGYDQRDATARAEMATYISEQEKAKTTEIQRQVQANLDSQKFVAEVINDLQKKNVELQEIIEKNDIEAQKDPNAGAIGLGVDSVRRLNRIGPTAH